MAKREEFMTMQDFAARRSVSKPAVTKWKKAGLPMHGGRVRVLAAEKWLKDNNLGQPRVAKPRTAKAAQVDEITPDGETLAQANRRKEIALANLREIDEAERRAELVDVGKMEQAWSGVGQTIRDALLGLPDKMTPTLAALTDKKQIRSYLMESLRQALTALPDEIRKRAA